MPGESPHYCCQSIREPASPQLPMPDLEIQISAAALPVDAPEWSGDFGAEMSFVGVVRGSEGGETIAGIDYSAYLPMAERALREMGEAATETFGSHRARISHRTGFVAVAEPSVDIRVSTAHSHDAFEIGRWYLAELKTQIPIWKRIVPIPDPS